MNAPGSTEQGTGRLPDLKAGMGRLARSSGGPHPDELSRGRKIAAWTCLGLATLLTVALMLTIWVKHEVLNENNWAHTSAQLLQDDQIRSSLSQYLVDEVYANVNVSSVLARELPEQARALAPALASGLQQLAVRGADELLQSPRMVQLWKDFNRRAVTAFVAILDGKKVGGLASADQGQVVIDLHPQVKNVAGLLGVSQDLPPDAGRLVVLRSNQLKAAQNGLKALRVLNVLLVILVLPLWVAAVWLAANRRRRVIRFIGWELVGVGIVLLVVREVAGGYVVDALVGDNLSVKPAASDAWAIGTDLLKQLAIALAIHGALIVVACWLAGRTRPAVALRRELAPTFHRRPWVVFLAALIAWLLVLLWAPSPGGHDLWVVLLVFVLLMAGVEALRRQTLREFPDAGAERADGASLWDRALGAGRRMRGRRYGAPTVPSPVEARVQLLERLSALKDRGALSAEEFEAQKTAVLSSDAAALT